MNIFTRNNPNFSGFSDGFASGPSAGHSTMYEPDFTDFNLSEMVIKKEVVANPAAAADDEDVHYESDEYYDEEGRKVQETDYGMESIPSMMDGKSSVGDFFVAEGALQQMSCYRPVLPKNEGENFPSQNPNITKEPAPYSDYTWELLSPTVRDPQCSVKTELAYFWPVYVSNFRCVHRSREYDPVKEYFASKGLHVRWWIQRKEGGSDTGTGIYDMLVYFVSEYDGALAIHHCHRDIYRGQTLNVFPGRVPVYFDPSRSLLVRRYKAGVVYSEQFFEEQVKAYNPGAKISCTVKFNMGNGAMEFKTSEDMQKARKVKKFKSKPLTDVLQKQRFLEEDMMKEIGRHLASNPRALQIDDSDPFLHMLLKGKRPWINPKVKRKPLNHVKRRVAERYRQQIARKLSEGGRPYCFSTHAANRECFYGILRQMKREQAEG